MDHTIIIDLKNETRRSVYQLERWLRTRRTLVRELEASLVALRATVPSLERCLAKHVALQSELEGLCAVTCDHTFTADGHICKWCGYECTNSAST